MDEWLSTTGHRTGMTCHAHQPPCGLRATPLRQQCMHSSRAALPTMCNARDGSGAATAHVQPAPRLALSRLPRVCASSAPRMYKLVLPYDTEGALQGDGEGWARGQQKRSN